MNTPSSQPDEVINGKPTPEEMRRDPEYARLLDEGFYFHSNIQHDDAWSQLELDHRVQQYLRFGGEVRIAKAAYMHSNPANEKIPNTHAQFLKPPPFEKIPVAERDKWVVYYYAKMHQQGGKPIYGPAPIAINWNVDGKEYE